MAHIFCGRNRVKRIALVLFSTMMVDIFMPTVSWALTSGPSQPEIQSFEAAGTTQMVDLFTGDFTYNIPLFELPGPNGGYPFNLAYHAGIGMDQEASWVGLGWNLNPGAINRQMRGLPDEFKGDEVITKNAVKTDYTLGGGMGIDFEIFGKSKTKTNKDNGTDTTKLGLNLKLGLSVFYNSYKGVGLETDIGSSFSKIVSSGKGQGLSMGLNANSQQGAGLQASYSVIGPIKDKPDLSGSSYIGAGFNSREGLTSLSLGSSASKSYSDTKKKTNGKERKRSNSISHGSYSSTLSLANQGYLPSIGLPKVNSSINLSVNLGTAWWGIEPNVNFNGFYNEQRLLNQGKNVYTPAYGYLNYQYALEDEAILDFNREKDGMVKEEFPNLAIPSLTYDIFSASGQGYSAMYRPFRNDIGIIHDPVTVSKTQALSIGGDVAPALSHVGVNATVNLAESTTGKWKDNNSVSNLYAFKKAEKNDISEPVSFKAHGEKTVTAAEKLMDLGGEAAVRLKLDERNLGVTTTLVQDKHNSWVGSANSNSEINSTRVPKNSVIIPVTNGDLIKSNGREVIDLFKINYFEGTKSSPDSMFRTKPKHHLAGFVALTPEGSRYVYGIPAYNLTQEEYTFTTSKVDNTTKVNVSPNNSNSEPDYQLPNSNKSFSKKIIPGYAHSYLLTAIVGQDYVDVKGDGVTEDDLGYWVKFTYRRQFNESNKYKWRAPFYKANYLTGVKATQEDDQANFLYGEKEIWYLDQVETKSHIAKFKLSDREDGRGAQYRLQNSNALGAAKLKRLDEIELYTRYSQGQVPLKKVKFEYGYDLCKNVENAPAGYGKLTLNKLWFEYGESTKGSLNPYVFDYHADNLNENPDYDTEDYDRWGNYRPNDDTDKLYNNEYPYLDQGEDKSIHDTRAGAWSLKEITLPSGGHMIIDYESDDYAYVQDRQAMQMLELVNPESKADGNFLLNDSDLRICFKLARPISVESFPDSVEAAKLLFESDRELLYFKLKINLRSDEENQFEFISTYASIDRLSPPYLSKGTGGYYDHGYLTLKNEKGYHPLSLRAWQHLKVNQPELASPVGKININDDEHGLVRTLKSLVGVLPMVAQMIGGFYTYAKGHDWGREIEGGKSWVRLCVPDKIKYGGGHRVRQITLLDNWQDNDEGIYGTVYDYKILEKGISSEISSGVAANEPNIGGEESPLRYAKPYPDNYFLASDNQLFFEYPINAGYYPGANVGYRQVTVMSLASASASGQEVLHATRDGDRPLFPTSEEGTYGTTGKTIHEFYTAKQFPVFSDETFKDDETFKLWIPAFPLGTFSTKKLACTQGYSTIINDMHGKEKKVSHFAQSKEGDFEKSAFSWVEYKYMSSTRLRTRQGVFELDNLFVDNNDGTLSKATGSNDIKSLYHLGQEVELFADMREYNDKSYLGGVSTNVDVLIIPIFFALVPVPAPSVWPSVGTNTKQLRTAVLNKIIYKSGILESTEAYNQGSKITTRHVKWDKLTGRSVLSVVNNNFDKPIYNHEIPAHMVYAGVGPAYQNIGFEFDISAVNAIEGRDNYYTISIGSTARQVLFEGDELIVYDEEEVPIGKAVYLGKSGSYYQLYSEDGLGSGPFTAKVYRSGKRNILSANAGSVSALKDPTQAVGSKNYSVDVLIEE